MVRRKPTLVLDMDETLIGTLATFSPTEELKAKCDMVHWVDGGFVDVGYFMWKRPGLDAFLRTMAPIYNVVLYTGASPIHAKFCMERIDPHREFIIRVMDKRFTERNHSSSETSQSKDLAKVRRNLKRIVWVDDTPAMYPEHQQVLGIVVPRFLVHMDKGPLVIDEGDNVLPQLTPFLVALAKLQDFREAIAAYKAGKCEVIDSQIAIDGQIVDTHYYEEEDDDDDEEDLAELEKKERLRELEEEERKRERRRQEEEEKQREEARKKAEEDRKQAEIDASLWKQVIDRYEARNLISASEKKQAINYISKKFRCDEADKIMLSLQQVKEVGSKLPNDSMYDALHELFYGLKGPSFDYDTRKWLLDVLAKVTVDFFYYGKRIEVVGDTEVIFTIAETQIPMFGDHARTLVFFEPIPMNAALNFLCDNKLLDVEVPASFQVWGKFASEGWWQHFVPPEFDKFWERHGGKLEDMIGSLPFTDCQKWRRLYGFTSEIVSGKQQICKCGEGISSRDDFFTSEECKFLVCTDDGTVLFRLKFEDGTIAKCAICVRKLASPNIPKLQQLCKDVDDLFLYFEICEDTYYSYYQPRPPFVKIRLSPDKVFSGKHLGMLNTKVESGKWLRKYDISVGSSNF